MTITKFLENAKFYEGEEKSFLDAICEMLGDYIYCSSCPLKAECEKTEEGYYCDDILKKYLTIK